MDNFVYPFGNSEKLGETEIIYGPNYIKAKYNPLAPDAYWGHQDLPNSRNFPVIEQVAYFAPSELNTAGITAHESYQPYSDTNYGYDESPNDGVYTGIKT